MTQPFTFSQRIDHSITSQPPLSLTMPGELDEMMKEGGKPVRAKKSKLEKICELESSLKVLKEENRRLRKDLHTLKAGASESPRRQIENNVMNYKEMDIDKMKDALKALKSVTVNQERSLQSLRAKANQRRKELKEKDHMIATLQKQVKGLCKVQKTLEGGDGENGIKAKVGEMQRALFEEETKNMKLSEKLEETEAQVKQLLKQLKSGAGSGDNSGRSSRSTDVSVSTTQEFDFTRMKKEVANKSNKINMLEMELEMVKDELHELKKKSQGKNEFAAEFPEFDDGFGAFTTGSGNAFSSDPFADDDGSYSEEEEEDFW